MTWNVTSEKHRSAACLELLVLRSYTIFLMFVSTEFRIGFGHAYNFNKINLKTFLNQIHWKHISACNILNIDPLRVIFKLGVNLTNRRKFPRAVWWEARFLHKIKPRAVQLANRGPAFGFVWSSSVSFHCPQYVKAFLILRNGNSYQKKTFYGILAKYSV